MIRIMITDDEQLVIDGIKFIIEKNFDTVEVVAVAKTGREAIEKSREFRPDIILMDIQMPGINGIEAIATIKEEKPDTKFIIISAYEQFEYAKQAVDLGVSDYVLKPINRIKLVEVITKAIQLVSQEQNQRQKEVENREKMEKVLPILEHGFIYSVLMNADYQEELSSYKELFDFQKDIAYIMVIELGEGDQPSKLQNKIGTGVKGQKFYPKVRNIIKYKYKCVIGPIIINRITVLIYEDPYEKEYDQRLAAIEKAETIQQKISEILGIEVFVGIGACYPLNKINHSHEGAVKALSKNNGESILHINDILEQDSRSSNYSYIDIKDDEVKLIQKIEEGRDDVITFETTNFLNKVEKVYGHQLLDAKNIILELMVLVISCAYRNDLEDLEVGYSTYLNEIRKIDQFYELQIWCIGKIGSITTLIKGKKEQHVSKVVQEAKTFIDDNYSKDISLKDVSKEVAISPQYFSKVFKDEVGLNFIEYLTNVRMEWAKTHLKENVFSVKEISYEVGYNDPNYFSRLFKKMIGISPTDYKTKWGG